MIDLLSFDIGSLNLEAWFGRIRRSHGIDFNSRVYYYLYLSLVFLKLYKIVDIEHVLQW